MRFFLIDRMLQKEALYVCNMHNRVEKHFVSVLHPCEASGLRQSNNLKTIEKLEKFKMYGFDTSCDKSRDFDLVSLTP
jgi:hypothetical protein